jgi:2-polyprenyl-3-methyl-5-hydroxy-6-metoxy-1,4-benzoquinol methylase
MKKAALDFNAMYLPVKREGRLLEVGSGGGDNLRTLQDIGWVVEGVDFDPKAVETARRKGLHVRQGILEEQQYPDEYFDAVTMSHLVEHVHDPLQLLRECRRVLRPGGRLVVVTPNIASVGHRLFSAAWLPLDPPRHLHLFSPRALFSLADRAGFQNKRVFTTIREAGNVFMASRNIKRSGRYVWGSVQPRLLKKAAKGMAVMEWVYLVFSPLAGEELVLVAEK